MTYAQDPADRSFNSYASQGFNPYPQWVLLFGGLLLIGLILFSHFYTTNSRIWASEQQRLSDQAEAMRHNIEYQLTAVHNVLVDMRENLAPHVFSVKQGIGIQKITTQSLMARMSIMPGVRTLGIVDRDGVMVASSRAAIIGENYGDRDYYQAPRADQSVDTMYVGAPFSVRPGTAWTLSLSHAVLDSSGEFEGVVFAALDASFFSALLSSMNYAPDMWTAIAHGNGRQFMITPERAGSSGHNLDKPDSLFNQYMESGKNANILIGRVQVTGDERIMALQTINPPALKLDWPLVLGTGRRLDAVFALWGRDLRLVLLFYALTVLASVALLYLYQRRIRAQVALNNALSSSLVTERRRLAGIIEATNVGTWEWRIKTGHVMFNDRWAEIAGYTLDELQPVSINTWYRLAHPDDAAKSDQLLEKHFNSELDYYDSEARIRHKSGEWVWVLGRGCVMQRDTDGSPVIMMGTHIDITDKKNAELRLQASLESLARYNQELEQFASVVSHDLRQPIRTVSGYLELLRAHLADRLTEDAEKMVAAAERGAQRLDQMLCGLLEYARTGLDDVPKASINMLDVITDVRDMLNSEFEHSHARMICPPEMGSVTIKACRDDLLRLFMNLISNAIKYRRPDTDPVIELAVSPVDGGWSFTITDNGVGFDPAQAGRLFNMFQRLHSQTEYFGSGIGLALCKKIVERYRGEIYITSSGLGNGARASFTLYY